MKILYNLAKAIAITAGLAAALLLLALLLQPLCGYSGDKHTISAIRR
jgi:hypothetical protein